MVEQCGPLTPRIVRNMLEDVDEFADLAKVHSQKIGILRFCHLQSCQEVIENVIEKYVAAQARHINEKLYGYY